MKNLWKLKTEKFPDTEDLFKKLQSIKTNLRSTQLYRLKKI